MKTLEQLEQLYPAFLKEPKYRVKNKMISDQRMITSTINIIFSLLFFIYLIITYTTDASSIFTRLLIFLILLIISSIIFKRKILPIGKISRNKISKMCEYVYLPERSTKYLQSSIKVNEEIIKSLYISIEKLKKYLLEIEISDEQKLSEAQKSIIEWKKENILEAIRADEERIKSITKEIKYNEKLILFLEEILTK